MDTPQFVWSSKQSELIGLGTGPYEVVDVDNELVALMIHLIQLIRTIFQWFALKYW